MIEERLFKWIESKEFGSGRTSVTAYSTGWAARVKDPKQPEKPAFPQALQWLRDNQLSDGSWGVEEPFTIFDRMLSTMIAVIAFKQWNLDEDQTRLQKGVHYINENWEKLIFYGRIPWQMTVGFEMIFPTLVEKATELLGIEEFGSNKDVLKNYVKAKNRKLKKIKKLEEKKKLRKEGKLEEEDGFKNYRENSDGEIESSDEELEGEREEVSKLKSWYYSLEGFDGDLYPKHDIHKAVLKNNLVAASYPVSAYCLYKGADLPQTYHTLENVIQERAGVPVTVDLDIFDLCWSVNYLYWAGVDMTHPAVSKQLDKLEKIWNDNNNGLVGGCMGLPPDCDDVANLTLALSVTKRISGTDSLDSLMKFWNYDMFVTYEGEYWKNRSISANLNALLALRQFYLDEPKQVKRLLDIDKYQKQVQYLIDDTGFDMEDKWHLSKYYSLGRAVFAFQEFDQEYTDICYRIMLHFQNEDGGWGGKLGNHGKCQSTPTETAYCIIPILYWFKLHGQRLEKEKKVPPIPARPILRKAKKYMDSTEEKVHPLWLEKVAYCMYNVDKTAILAAKYALEVNEHLYK